VLRRNLAGEVHEALLTYQQALGAEAVAGSAVESATESMKLTQQKYNVGSATILDLIDAQVQLQRAQSQLVSALAGIRVAEARLDQVRGRGV
jgi:outer membrane protein TolC